MKFSASIRREIGLISAVSALVLAPLLYLGLKSAFGPRIVPAIAAVQPILGARGRSGVTANRAMLSPDGRWIACMEVPVANQNASKSPGALSALATEVVIRSARGGEEIFRESVAGQFVGWIPRSANFVTQNGLDITVFSLPPRKPGAPAPTQPWISTTLTFPGDPKSVGGVIGAGGSAISEFYAGAIEFSPDFRFAVRASWQQGDIWWQVADLKTGQIAPPVKAGHWLDYNPKIGGYSNNISISVAPANLATRGLPLVAVVQITSPLSRANNPAAPRSGAVSKPMRPLTPEQNQFVADAKTEVAKIQALYKRRSDLFMNYGPQTEAQVAQIDALIAARMRAMSQNSIKTFTPPKNQAAALKRLDTPKTLSLLEDTKAFGIECFDLGQRRKLWSAPLHAQTFAPQSRFSPDGAAVVVWNTARLFTSDKWGKRLVLNDSGIDLLAPKTGKKRAAFRLYEADFSIPNSHQAWFYRQDGSNGSFHSILTFPDSRNVREKASQDDRDVFSTRTIPVARLFDTTLGREVGHLEVERRGFERDLHVQNFSTDDRGNVWLFGINEYQIASRSKLGREIFSPLPRPTPIPTPQPTP